ncbi:hypothetical protein FJ471_15660 [Mesorhizobium sp. B2-7-1]|nr:hypothetical protein FJ471_15660 [Mesorhizobium sp. B2-7-1]
MMPKSVKRFSGDIMLHLFNPALAGWRGRLNPDANHRWRARFRHHAWRGSHEAAARTVGGGTWTHRRHNRRRLRHRADLDRAGDQGAIA